VYIPVIYSIDGFQHFLEMKNHENFYVKNWIYNERSQRTY